MSEETHEAALTRAVRKTRNKAFVRTTKAQDSGVGTDMHSRPGKSTINLYKAFQKSKLITGTARTITDQTQ